MRGRPHEPVVAADGRLEHVAHGPVRLRGEVLPAPPERPRRERADAQRRQGLADRPRPGVLAARVEGVVGEDDDPAVVAVDDDLLQDAGHVARRADGLVLGLARRPLVGVEEPPGRVEGDEAEALGRLPLARPAALVARHEGVAVEQAVHERLETADAVLALVPVPVAGHDDDLALEPCERLGEGFEVRLDLGPVALALRRHAVRGHVAQKRDRRRPAPLTGVGAERAEDGLGLEVARVARQQDRVGDLAVRQRGGRLGPVLAGDVGAGRGAPRGEHG